MTGMVIVLAGSKGGVSKTTLSAGLCVQAMEDGYEVVITDIDPQQSLDQWYQLRSENGKSSLPELAPWRQQADEQIEHALACKGDVLIIDTPPGSTERTKLAVEVADLIVVPVRASPIDIQAMDAIADLAVKYNKEFVFVMSATKPNSKITMSCRRYLAAFGPVLDLEIGDRVAYSSSFFEGLVGSEVDRKGAAGEEMAAVWAEIEKRAKRAARRRKKAAA